MSYFNIFHHYSPLIPSRKLLRYNSAFHKHHDRFWSGLENKQNSNLQISCPCLDIQKSHSHFLPAHSHSQFDGRVFSLSNLHVTCTSELFHQHCRHKPGSLSKGKAKAMLRSPKHWTCLAWTFTSDVFASLLFGPSWGPPLRLQRMWANSETFSLQTKIAKTLLHELDDSWLDRISCAWIKSSSKTCSLESAWTTERKGTCGLETNSREFLAWSSFIMMCNSLSLLRRKEEPPARTESVWGEQKKHQWWALQAKAFQAQGKLRKKFKRKLKICKEASPRPQVQYIIQTPEA